MIYKIIAIELLIIGNAYYDRYKIDKGIAIDHNANALIRFLYVLSCSLIGTRIGWLTLAEIGLFLSLFFLQFDYLLNFLRGKKWHYLGTSKLDAIFKGYSMRYVRLIFKIAIVVIFCYIYLRLRL